MKYLPLLILFAVVLGCASSKPELVPTVAYTTPKIRSDRANLLVEFEVVNTSEKTLEFVKVESSFYDQKGDFVTSESSYIAKYQSLEPGDRSPVVVQTPLNAKIKSVDVSFTSKGKPISATKPE